MCVSCGEIAARWCSDPLPAEFRDGTYWVEGFTYEHCDACGEGALDASQLDEVLAAGVALARADLGRLSSDEIHQLRLDLGLTQADLEAQLGVRAGMVEDWERGTVLQEATVDRLMRLLRAHPELVEELDCIARESREPYRERG
jgi:putative zinc finger/helix-turn-helix YgiT family protein